MSAYDLAQFPLSVQPLSDDFGIGQRAVARIRLDLAQQEMAEAAPEAFTLRYIPAPWRTMRRRQFQKARAEYERAKVISEGKS